MPLNFYENQTSHMSASQFQSAPSASEIDKADQLGASTSTRTGAGAQSLGRALRTDYGASRIELWQGIMFYQTHQSHLVKFLCLMLLLMLLLPILMML
jgi:hypothetical protein